MSNTISAGAKRDLLIINLAIGLIQTSLNNEDEVKNDKDLTKRTNKDYKLNKRIDRRLEKLVDRLQKTQTEVFEKYGEDGKLGKWVKGKLNSNFLNIFNNLKPNINLELLANQTLFECFMERDKPLMDEYMWLRDSNSYSIFDLLVETEAGKVEGETYEDAQMIKRMLR